MHRTLGGKRDAHDERDYAFEPHLASAPSAVSLRANCPAVYNQLPLHSCGAHAVASAMQVLSAQRGTNVAEPSRLFLYYNARRREGPVSGDDGATIRNTIKAAARPGACSEQLWPYDPAKVNVEPRRSAYENIALRASSYYRIAQRLTDLKSCIAEGFPFVFGLSAYTQAIIAAQTSGRLELPTPTDTLMTAHAMLAIGYDDATSSFTALNSLGPTWGAQGYVTMPFEYFTDPQLTHDFWTIRTIG